MCHLNVNGWTPDNQTLRQAILLTLNAEIISLNETHLDGDSDIELDGYKFYGHNRGSRHVRAAKTMGGVGFFIKRTLLDNFNIFIIDKVYEGILALKLEDKISNYTIVVISAYLPPEYSRWGRDSEGFFSHVLSLVYTYAEADALFVLGDLNARVGDLDDTINDLDNIPPRKPIDSVKNNHGSVLIEFLTEAKLCMLNGRTNGTDNYTCVSTKGVSVVDYILVPHENYTSCTQFNVDLCSNIIEEHQLQQLLNQKCKIPDHSVLSVLFRDPEEHLGIKNQINQSPDATKCRYNRRKLNDQFLQSNLCKSALLKVIEAIECNRETQHELDRIYGMLCDTIISEMNKQLLIPNSTNGKKTLKQHKPYWNSELTRLWKEMCDAERRMTRCYNRLIRRDLRSHFICVRKNFDKKLRYYERNYKRGKMLELEEICTSDPRCFYDQLKKLGPQRKRDRIPHEVYDVNGDISYDQNTVLSRWQNDFCALYNTHQTNIPVDAEFIERIKETKNSIERIMTDVLYDNNDYINRNITNEEVRQIALKAKNGKATGMDNIPYEVLKFENVISTLTHLYQLCFDSGRVPSEWNLAIICPILKSKASDVRLPANYRGVSLLSTISKLYTCLLNSRLSTFLESNSTLTDEQNGFRKDRSCLDQIYNLTTIVKNRLNRNLPTFATYIDFQKAFDCIDRDLLLFTIYDNGVCGKMYFAIKSLYLKTRACVRVNELHTDWFDTTRGVRQGDSMSTTLFSIYINSLSKELNQIDSGIKIGSRHITHLLYADDLVLIASSEQKLQQLHNCVTDWCRKWKMSVNRSKTKVMHFRKTNQKQTPYNFTICNEILEFTKQYKYLGLYISYNLSFKEGMEILSDAASRSLGMLISRYKILKHMLYNTYHTLYRSSVIPIMDYASEIWGMQKFDKGENVQNRAARAFLGVHKFAPVPGMQGDLGWISSNARRKCNIVRYWNRLVSMNDARLTKQIFLWDHELSRNNWSSDVKAVFEQLDIDPANYDQLNTVDLNIVSQKCFDYDQVLWRERSLSKAKLRTYNSFKEYLCTEKYVKSNLNRKERSLIAQLRLGILPLKLETGRFEKLPLENRLCEFCDSKEIENEVHFVFKCDLYKDLRQAFLAKIPLGGRLNTEDTNANFKLLFEQFPRQLGKFIKTAYDMRRKKLYHQITVN